MDKTGKSKRRLDARYVLGITVILLLIFGLGVRYQAYISGVRPAMVEAANIIAVADFAAEHNEGDVIIMLSGETARKGYYAVSPDTSLREILEFAGLTAESDISEFDLAHQPTHGDEYYVRSTADPLDITPWLSNTYQPAAEDEEAETDLVNLNTATLDELKTLPNIGDVKAQAIIDYRIEHNGFRYKEELLGVEGIGQKTYENLVDKVTL